MPPLNACMSLATVLSLLWTGRPLYYAADIRLVIGAPFMYCGHRSRFYRLSKARNIYNELPVHNLSPASDIRNFNDCDVFTQNRILQLTITSLSTRNGRGDYGMHAVTYLNLNLRINLDVPDTPTHLPLTDACHLVRALSPGCWSCSASTGGYWAPCWRACWGLRDGGARQIWRSPASTMYWIGAS